ncbi:hypothetical protein ABK040_000064 [Willaertia magna]
MKNNTTNHSSLPPPQPSSFGSKVLSTTIINDNNNHLTSMPSLPKTSIITNHTDNKLIPISNDLFQVQSTTNQQSDVTLTTTPQFKFICEKCGSQHYRLGEVRSCGSLMAKIFNVQNRRFTTITCTQCGYTQFFESSQSFLSNVLDILIR